MKRTVGSSDGGPFMTVQIATGRDRSGWRRSGKSLVWGVFLMALGSAFLLDRLGVVQMPNLGSLWPLVFPVIGIAHLAEGQFGSAMTFLLLGAWFFACEYEWYGLDYHNSWPLVLVAIGAGIVLRALGLEPGRRVREGGGS